MQATDKPRHSPAAAYEVVDEAAIIINTRTGSYYSLNDTGARFWQLLDGRRTIADCARLIAGEYDAPADEIEADMMELALEFKMEELIEI